jgi:hypothetical protein
MPQAFLASRVPHTEIQATTTAATPIEPGREKVRILVFGSVYSTDRVIHELYRVGFAEVTEWSKPLPTGVDGEVVRVLAR